jgi:ubiquinone/menaquinone biosynthesis C-methylase UbiE
MSNPPSPSPSPFAEPLPWNLVASGYNDENFAHFAKYAADALELAEVKPGERLLDVAAGPGSLAIQAAAQATEVQALDFSTEMLSQLRSRIAAEGITNLVAREGDGQALPYADASFDAAFSMFGLMFFPDRIKGFRELRRVLKPGGRAVVASWLPMGEVPLLAAVFEALAAELPELPFGNSKGPLTDPEEFRRELAEGGLSEIQIVKRTHALETPGVDSLWASMRRSLAPLVLLEHRLGAESFAPVLEGIHRRLRERFNGPLRIEMAAWLGLGRKSS